MLDLLTMYCVCLDHCGPRHTQFNQKNIICDASKLKSERRAVLENYGYIFDNDGDNISLLNYAFGDLTATYWIWKNSQEEFVGTNQYRRFWNEDQVTNLSLNDQTIYTFRTTPFNMTAMEQYIYTHTTHGIQLVNRAIEQVPGFKLQKSTFDLLYEIDYIFPCHMFFCHKNLYNRICEVWFSILFDLYSIVFAQLSNLPGPEGRRTIAFISERIMTTLFLDAKRYFGPVNLEFVSYDTVGEKRSMLP